MRDVWTLYGDTNMVVSLSVVLAEASRNVFAELPSSSESRLDPYYVRPGWTGWCLGSKSVYCVGSS